MAPKEMITISYLDFEPYDPNAVTVIANEAVGKHVPLLITPWPNKAWIATLYTLALVGLATVVFGIVKLIL